MKSTDIAHSTLSSSTSIFSMGWFSTLLNAKVCVCVCMLFYLGGFVWTLFWRLYASSFQYIQLALHAFMCIYTYFVCPIHFGSKGRHRMMSTIYIHSSKRKQNRIFSVFSLLKLYTNNPDLGLIKQRKFSSVSFVITCRFHYFAEKIKENNTTKNNNHKLNSLFPQLCQQKVKCGNERDESIDEWRLNGTER